METSHRRSARGAANGKKRRPIGGITILDVATQFGVPFSSLREYVLAFERKELIDLRPVSSLDAYHLR